MAVATKQYNSFLGGLVGEACQYRTDMERFGKWFDTANNVRFNDLGSFGNRPGFQKIAETKKNDADEDIRLLSFSFNDDNSYLIEMTNDVLRFYKDGRLVTVGNEPYELKNELNLTIGKDIKYAQAADVIYLCDGTQNIKELRRMQDDENGFRWEFADFKFKFGAMPLDYENNDESKTISVQDSGVSGEGTSFTSYDVFLKFRDNFPFFKDLKITIKFQDGPYIDVINTARNFYSLDELVSYINANNLYNLTATAFPSQKRLNFSYGGTSSLVCLNMQITGVSSANTTTRLLTYDDATMASKAFPVRYYYNNAIKNISGKEYEIVSTGTMSGFDPNRENYFLAYMGFTNNATDGVSGGVWGTDYIYYKAFSRGIGVHRFHKINTTIYEDIMTEWAPLETWTFTKDGSTEFPLIATSNFDFWSDKEVGDVFGIRHRVSGQSVFVNKDNEKTVYLDDTDGSWGLITSGGWKGHCVLYYSVDKKVSWKEFYRVSSGDWESGTPNVNVTGEIEPDGPAGVDFKMVVTMEDYNGDAWPSWTLKTDPYETISYYEILNFIPVTTGFVTQAYVKGIKNHIGEILSSDNWREGIFSNSKGWPKAIGFYQNRLFISKDWYLYGSKTNDFYDFYEPIELADDDPVTMSLLSYKVNTIENIVLLKGFFVFTGGGEFNIVSEGALTQKDKNLQQFSAHGSIQALPVIVGNHIMFVDKSANTVRAMRYVFDADTYEAEDVSILLENNINGEVIKTIEHMANSHEVLFLTESGKVFVFKFLPEQQIACWSVWEHGYGTITNICVVPNGHKEDLYVAVSTKEGKHIERLSEDIYKDSYMTYLDAPVTSIQTPFQEGLKVHVTKTKDSVVVEETATVGIDGVIDLQGSFDKVVLGFPYKTEATLLSPELILDQMGGNTVYNKKRPFKAHFIYRKSKGFKVGVKDGEKMEIQWQDVNSSIDDENKLTSGKKSVLIPCRYDGTGRVSFVQEEPFRFEILNAGIEVDYGGK